jgi:hypothetical protein
MQKRIMLLVFAGALAQIPVTTVSPRAAPAAEDCVTAPDRQAPAGSHWYYRSDRANHRKCWYLADQAARAHRLASPKMERPAKPTRLQAERSAADRQPGDETRVEQPVAGARLARELAQAADAPSAEASQNGGPPAAAWSSPVTSAGSGDAAASTSNQPVDVGQAADQRDAAVEVPAVEAPAVAPPAPAETEQHAAAIDPKPVLALLACALGLAAVLGRFTFRHVALRRPRRGDPREPRDIAWIARERLQPTLPETVADQTEPPIVAEPDVPFAPWRGRTRPEPKHHLDAADEIEQLLRTLEQNRERSAA